MKNQHLFPEEIFQITFKPKEEHAKLVEQAVSLGFKANVDCFVNGKSDHNNFVLCPGSRWWYNVLKDFSYPDKPRDFLDQFIEEKKNSLITKFIKL